MSDSDHARPLRGEIDSGVRIAVLDGSTPIAVVYRPLLEMEGFDNSKVYYYVTAEIPSTTSTITVEVTTNCSAPGFSPGAALTATCVSMAEQGSAPSSSSTLWVDKTDGSWAVDWQMTGTGSEARGSVTWWRTASGLFAPSWSSRDAANSVTPSSSLLWKGTDSPA